MRRLTTWVVGAILVVAGCGGDDFVAEPYKLVVHPDAGLVGEAGAYAEASPETSTGGQAGSAGDSAGGEAGSAGQGGTVELGGAAGAAGNAGEAGDAGLDVVDEGDANEEPEAAAGGASGAGAGGALAGAGGAPLGGSSGAGGSQVGGAAGAPAGGAAGAGGSAGNGGTSLGGSAGAGGSSGASGAGGTGGTIDAGPVSLCPLSTRYFCDADTATDSWTGLVWQRKPYNSAISWNAAISHCADLPSGGYWRLPSKEELVSIYQPTYPALDPYAFPGVFSPTEFWSSTKNTGCPGSMGNDVWIVTFEGGGGASCWWLTSTVANARCVH